MPEITIPDQEITLKTYPKRDGTRGEITCFAALYNGKLLTPCEAFGNRKAQLEEAMKGNKPLEIEAAPEHNTQYNRWNIKFPRGSGGQADYRGRFGSARPWTPAGYRGQPVPYEAWLQITADVLRMAVAELTACAGDGAVTDPVRVAVLEQARSLVAQYWMSVEHNLTFPTGYEPRAEPVAAPPLPNAKANGDAKPSIDAAAQDVYVAAIEAAVNEREVRAVMDSVRKMVKDKVRQAELLTMCLRRIRELTPPQPAPTDTDDIPF